jgi:hypothetical protein
MTRRRTHFHTLEAAQSRYELAVTPSNYLDKLNVVTERTRRWIRPKDQSWATRRMGYHGIVKKGGQFSLHVYFSDDDGDTFDSPLVSAPGNRIIQLKLEIAQLNVDPLLQGFGVKWRLPNGWVFTDGLDNLTYEVSNSNPLIFTRTVRSPTNPQPAGFRATIVRQFKR